MSKSDGKLNLVFTALADDTRRKVIERLGTGPAAVSELASQFEMALLSFVQHLGILERCGLIRSQKTGRVRTCYIVPKRIKAIDKWMKTQRSMWKKKRLD